MEMANDLANVTNMLSKLPMRTLIYDRGKLIAALVGVIFSVALVNVQGRLLAGLLSKASLQIAQGNADIWVGRGNAQHQFRTPNATGLAASISQCCTKCSRRGSHENFICRFSAIDPHSALQG